MTHPSRVIELVIDPASKAGLFNGRVGNKIVVRSRHHSSTVPERFWRADADNESRTYCRMIPAISKNVAILIAAHPRAPSTR